MSLTNPPIYTSWRNMPDAEARAALGNIGDLHLTNEEAIALLQSENAALRSRVAADPEPVDFNQEYELPEYEKAPSYARRPLEVSFDGAEGGAVWICDEHKDEMIAIRGPEAMRELARLILAFADGYTDEA